MNSQNPPDNSPTSPFSAGSDGAARRYRERGGDPVDVGQLVKRLLTELPAAGDVFDDAPGPACGICNDTGWVYPGDPDLPENGLTVMCPCRQSAWVAGAEARLQKHWQHVSGVPKHFRDYRLETHPNLMGAANLGLLSRLRASAVEGVASWWLWGPFGNGKTAMAAGYAWAFLQETGGSVCFRTLPALLAELRATYDRTRRRSNPWEPSSGDEGETEADVLRRYQTCGLLVLDDLGAEYIPQHADPENTWIADRLYQIVGTRHDEERPIVFTSNLDPEAVAARIGPRVVWRAVEMAGAENIVQVQGRNLRKTWE